MIAMVVFKYILALFSQSSLRKVSEIKGNQFESCLANSAHQSDFLAISLKAKQKCHGTTQGPDLDFTR